MRRHNRTIRDRLAAGVVCERGAAAAEMVLVAPFIVALILAAINMGFMMYSGATLHFAAEDAARCGAVNSTTCGSVTATQAYARTQYGGMTGNPTFTASLSSTCSQVTAAATYRVALGIASFTVPLNARACYPLQPTT